MGITVQAQDAVHGRGTAGLGTRLERAADGRWVVDATARTDDDGCVNEWYDRRLGRGIYRIVFDSDRYFVALGLRAAYPEIVLTFRILDEDTVGNIAVVLSPYFYSACFGSLS
ncbi:hydroxyisourate hydrolase [Nonomuraea sp. MG754425]|uniref:hydroxyisourate hydrolase n=1 Tax=Nonomuraea sp. MG754425 TaxID=2570319 RepID=UPI001F466BA5|nr:hydroxyisourate hydrolase [Nonomuraea sp. MG754425]MCF6474026.1 hydroxyisourate hydrolase [Nonomuraea sp. MG754425]